MELTTPKCIGGKDCYSVCNAKSCQNKPFMCVDGCQCQQSHQQCFINIKWKLFKKMFQKKLIKPSIETKNYLNKIDQIYKSIMKQVQISYSEMRNLQYTLGLNQIQKDIFNKLREERANQLTGNMINKIQLKYRTLQITIINELIQESKKQISKQTEILLKMVQKLTGYKQLVEIDSKLINSIQMASLFQKKIKKCNLLYRASENNFQVSKFHEKCDDKPHTITILKTQFGNIIGGYTPLSWYKRNGYHQTDNSMQSFIFSLTTKHKLKLNQNKKGQNAIYKQSSYGPTFGTGYDLWISDKANQNKSGGRPGETYNYNNEYVYNQQSYKKWSGQSSGYYFKIQQWQVYSIVFA